MAPELLYTNNAKTLSDKCQPSGLDNYVLRSPQEGKINTGYGHGKLSWINVLSEGHSERSTAQITLKTELEREGQPGMTEDVDLGATAEIMAD